MSVPERCRHGHIRTIVTNGLLGMIVRRDAAGAAGEAFESSQSLACVLSLFWAKEIS